jgi:pyruvate formate lyase activating enzyme
VADVGDEVPVHFTAFHPAFRLRDCPPTPPETLTRAREIARCAGLKHAYTGNVFNSEGQSTHCPGCGAAVIERDGYGIGAYRLKSGRCAGYGRTLAGHFDEAAGDWGARRLQVDVRSVVEALGGRCGRES